MRNILFLKLLGLVCILFSGCASQDQTLSTDPVCLPDVQADQAMEAAKTVLSKMHFQLEKDDRDACYMRTRPLSGAQFFEFWRHDNASAFSGAQANLHSIRRIVELEFAPQNTKTCIQCRVQVLRLSVPEEPLIGAERMSGIYTESSSRFQSLQMDDRKTGQIEWLDAGTDRSLERKILTMIQKQMQKGTKS